MENLPTLMEFMDTMDTDIREEFCTGVLERLDDVYSECTLEEIKELYDYGLNKVRNSKEIDHAAIILLIYLKDLINTMEEFENYWGE